MEAGDEHSHDSGFRDTRAATAPPHAVPRRPGHVVVGLAPRHGRDDLLLSLRARPGHRVGRVSPEAYNAIIDTYKTPIIGLLEMGLVVAVLYHALNGIRIILIDFWQNGPKYQRLMLWVVLAVWITVFIAALGVMGMHMAERFL